MKDKTGVEPPAPKNFDLLKDKEPEPLRQEAIGLIGVLLLTVTGAAPLTAMLGNIPFAVGFGNGAHVPATFLVATVVLTIFSVGYAAMATQISSAGGFYTFISLGLGREAGMSAGLASLIAYSLFEAALSGIFAFFANTFVSNHFGFNIPWLYLALFSITLCGALSYFDISLSAKVLGVALILEVLVLLVFDAAVVTGVPGTHFSLESMNILNVMSDVPSQKIGKVTIPAGSAPVGIFMAFWSWCGFEMAPSYAEESIDPKRNIPRSLYFSVIALGIFFTLTSWCAVSAFADDDRMLVMAVSDSGNFFIEPMRHFVGSMGASTMSLLILSSTFACGMAFHNTAARYLYSLAREGVFPTALGHTHPYYKSPHVASITQSLLAFFWVIPFAYFSGTDAPNEQAYLGVYTMLATLGTMLLLILQAFVSLAILVYFKTKNKAGRIEFSTFIAPAFSFFSLAALVYLLVAKLDTFGGVGAFGSKIPHVVVAVIIVGFVWGAILRITTPAVYARIGRLLYTKD